MILDKLRELAAEIVRNWRTGILIWPRWHGRLEGWLYDVALVVINRNETIFNV
jgi:hypothetical protein